MKAKGFSLVECIGDKSMKTKVKGFSLVELMVTEPYWSSKKIIR